MNDRANMTYTRTPVGSDTAIPRLVLRAHRAGARIDDFYICSGLTIGRSAANVMQIEDDEHLEREHAVVEIHERGALVLRCVGPHSSVLLNDLALRELQLTAGISFCLGKTVMECLPARSDDAQKAAGPTCPYCRIVLNVTGDEKDEACPACQKRVLPLSTADYRGTPIVVPVVYGEYRAQRLIARGGMGIVLYGCDDETRPVAIKLISPFCEMEPASVARFKREAAVMRQLSHPHLVPLLDEGDVAGFRYLAMEWMEGTNLRDLISHYREKQERPLFATVAVWLEQVCGGLAAVHGAGIRHRDIKPSNILIDSQGRARISDFGVALQAGLSSDLTMTGELPGTYEYMAPERWSGADGSDARSDLYSLGATFYELLTLGRPIGLWPLPSAVNQTVPAAMDDVFKRLLASDPGARFQSAGDVGSTIAFLANAAGRLSGNQNADDVVHDCKNAEVMAVTTPVPAKDANVMVKTTPVPAKNAKAIAKATSDDTGTWNIVVVLFVLFVLWKLPWIFGLNSWDRANAKLKTEHGVDMSPKTGSPDNVPVSLISWSDVTSFLDDKSRTDLQKVEAWKDQFQGKKVSWGGLVVNARDTYSGPEVEIRMEEVSGPATPSVAKPGSDRSRTVSPTVHLELEENERQAALSLKRGDRISFVGILGGCRSGDFAEAIVEGLFGKSSFGSGGITVQSGRLGK